MEQLVTLYSQSTSLHHAYCDKVPWQTNPVIYIKRFHGIVEQSTYQLIHGQENLRQCCQSANQHKVWRNGKEGRDQPTDFHLLSHFSLQGGELEIRATRTHMVFQSGAPPCRPTAAKAITHSLLATPPYIALLCNLQRSHNPHLLHDSWPPALLLINCCHRKHFIVSLSSSYSTQHASPSFVTWLRKNP